MYSYSLHSLIPSGVLTSQGKLHGVKSDYLFPVKALANVYRAKMMQALRHRELVIEKADELMKKSWNVYSKACLSRAETVVSYLGRYTRKGMLHESRIKAVSSSSVSFKYTDYGDGNKRKMMQLTADEFIRRYLLHVLPKGVMRVRHFGFLANACKRKRLALIKEQLSSAPTKTEKTTVVIGCQWLCPQCKEGYLLFVGIIKPLSQMMMQGYREQLRLSG